MTTPLVAGEPFSLLGRQGAQFAELDANNAARLETYQKSLEAKQKFAQALITSAAAADTYGGMQIGALTGGLGVPGMAPGALTGAYTGGADTTRAAGAARTAAGGGGGGSGGGDAFAKSGGFYKITMQDGSTVLMHGTSSNADSYMNRDDVASVDGHIPSQGEVFFDARSGGTKTYSGEGPAYTPAPTPDVPEGGDVGASGDTGGGGTVVTPPVDGGGGGPTKAERLKRGQEQVPDYDVRIGPNNVVEASRPGMDEWFAIE